MTEELPRLRGVVATFSNQVIRRRTVERAGILQP